MVMNGNENSEQWQGPARHADPVFLHSSARSIVVAHAIHSLSIQDILWKVCNIQTTKAYTSKIFDGSVFRLFPFRFGCFDNSR